MLVPFFIGFFVTIFSQILLYDKIGVIASYLLGLLTSIVIVTLLYGI